MKSEKRYTRDGIISLMRTIAKRNGLVLSFLKADEGKGGYNYGGSTGDCIMLAPFVAGKKGDVIDGIPLDADCENPLECMLITFFHEYAHCKMADDVPYSMKGYSCNMTSRFQYELWITMLGINAARSYGIVFSDATIKWMLRETMTYADTVFARDSSKDEYTVEIDAWWLQGEEKHEE